MTALFQQRQALDNDLRSVLATAVEAMGYEGMLHLNPETWEVTITPIPESPAEPVEEP